MIVTATESNIEAVNEGRQDGGAVLATVRVVNHLGSAAIALDRDEMADLIMELTGVWHAMTSRMR